MPFHVLLGGWALKKATQYGATKAGEKILKHEVEKHSRKGARKVKEVLAGMAGVELPQAAPEKTVKEKLADNTLGRVTGLLRNLERQGKGEPEAPVEVTPPVVEPKMSELAVLSGQKIAGRVLGNAQNLREKASGFVRHLEEQGKASEQNGHQTPSARSNTPDQMM